MKRPMPFFRFQQWRWKRITGCTDLTCRGPKWPHRACVDCGEITDSKTVRVDRDLRRRVVPVCFYCWFGQPDKRNRKLRAQTDWAKQLQDQFPGPVRTTLHGFIESPDPERRVRNIDAGRLNASLEALGLADQLWAEQRGKQTYLRKVGQ